MINNESHICRVCGYNCGEPLWDEDNPNWIICDCCGSESGYEDFTLDSIFLARKNWISNEYRWFDIKRKPTNWDFRQQLINIPDRWK
jgi:hypothetical protein